MILLGIDLETTGLDPEQNHVTEVGLALWDTDVRQIVRCENFFVRSEEPIPAEVTALTGITQAMGDSYGRESKVAYRYLLQWVAAVDVLVAHNAPFDRSFLEEWGRRLEMPFPEKPWLDTRADLDDQIPEKFSRKLHYLAADLQIFNPYPHRAVFDVVTMLRILDQYDLDRALKMSVTPSVTIEALVSFEDKNKAKDIGYHWKPETKQWLLTIKECFLERELVKATEAGFKVWCIDAKS